MNDPKTITSSRLLELKPIPTERQNEWTEVISVPLGGKYVTQLNVLFVGKRDSKKMR